MSKSWTKKTQPIVAILLCFVLFAAVAEAFATKAATSSQEGPSTRSRMIFSRCFSKKETKEATATTEPANPSDDTANNDTTSNQKNFKVQTWNPLRLAVLRLGLTEPAATSPFNYGKYDGVFRCAYCGQTLFDSNAKYDSGSGWPSFWRSASDDAIGYRAEFGGRLECRCQRCSSHLGHVFLDGPRPASVPQELLEASPASDPRGRESSPYLPRFCINGAAMTFQSRKE